MTPSGGGRPMVSQLTRHKFTVGEYHKMKAEEVLA